ncbi:MAG: hypothetical protein WBL28_05915 [Methylotenera sp.]
MFAFLQKLFQSKEPNAALAWQQAGNQAGSAYWLYAVPVHLVLQRDSFSLAAPAPLSLESHEAAALTSAFNQHFASDGMQFFWHETIWFLNLQSNPRIETTAPETASNKDIRAYLPKGDGAIQWANFTNEMQMLLFEHPVNQAREAKRLPVINSIWCYGGGQVASDAH